MNKHHKTKQEVDRDIAICHQRMVEGDHLTRWAYEELIAELERLRQDTPDESEVDMVSEVIRLANLWTSTQWGRTVTELNFTDVHHGFWSGDPAQMQLCHTLTDSLEQLREAIQEHGLE